MEDRLLLLLSWREKYFEKDCAWVRLVQIQPPFLFHLNYKMLLFVLCNHLIGFGKEHNVIYCALALYFNLFFSSRTN